MRVYIKVREGEVIELGRRIKVEESKVGVFITTTGDYERELIIKECKDRKEGERIIGEIMQRVVEPRAKEIERGVVYIEI